jgi:2-methylcitrate dehydratase PrpD
MVGCQGPASIWGTGLKTDCGYAALANGVMVESFTMDDLHNRSIVHAGSVSVPAALAVAEWLGNVSGEALLAAIIAGYETAIRVGLGVSPSTRVRGHHPVGICGPFGAAAAAGKLLGLDEEKMSSALGNAGSQAAGLMSAQFGFMTQRLHAGKADQSGILAAFLARNGFTGTTNILEAEYGGFCRTYADHWSLENITAGLGSYFETLNVGLRPYACAGSVCTTVDAVKTLKEKHKIDPADVAQVVVTCNESIFLHCGFEYKPDTLIAAQMNIPYGAAVTLLEGDASVDQYTEEKIRDPRVLELTSRVKVVHNPELDAKGESHAYYVHVEITTLQGQKYATEVYWAKGTPANPLSEKELAAKCHRLADNVIGANKVARLIDLVLNLDQVREVSLLLELL